MSVWVCMPLPNLIWIKAHLDDGYQICSLLSDKIRIHIEIVLTVSSIGLFIGVIKSILDLFTN